MTLPPNNLPHQLTSFIGREREIAEVRARLGKARLLTLTGAGGSGKTRLALEVATGLLDSYRHGVWFVDLSPLTDPNLVPHAVAVILGVQERSGQPITSTLISWLKERETLLLLDNCEHLVEACAQLANTLLRACPDLRILATSREILRLSGEILWQVSSLTLPADPHEQHSLDSLSRYEAIQLFTERARLKRQNFTLTEKNAGTVAEICRRLDGLPLAIELATARTGVLSVEEIRERLNEIFKLLTGGSQTAPLRQRTLEAAIDWSYNILTEPEQELLQALSVFAGGARLETIEAICEKSSIHEDDTSELLFQLVDKSLAVWDEQKGHARYRLLETIRQYIWKKLSYTGRVEDLRDAHLHWYLQLAEEAEPALTGSEQVEWLERLEEEHDNLRVALQWAFESVTRDAGEAVLRLSGALCEFWFRRSYYKEGQEWLEAALRIAHSEKHLSARAKVIYGIGGLSSIRGDYLLALASYEQSLELYQKLQDSARIAASLRSISIMYRLQGNYAQSQSLLEESLALSKQLNNHLEVATTEWQLGGLALRKGDYATARALYQDCLAIYEGLASKGNIAWALWGLARVTIEEGEYEVARSLLHESLNISREAKDEARIADILNQLAELERMLGNYTIARPLYEESLDIRRKLDERWNIAQSLHNLGHVAHREGDYERASALFVESLILCRELDHKWVMAWSLAGLAGVAATLGQPERSARLFAATQTLLEEMDAVLDAADRIEYERNLAYGRGQVTEERWARAWSEGRALTLEQALDYALEAAVMSAERDKNEHHRAVQEALPVSIALTTQLTRREIEVLRLLQEGLTNEQIATRLFLSRNTVHAHLTSIYGKLNVAGRHAATRFAVEHHLV